MSRVYKIPLLLTPQAGGGFTITSPVIPELVTEADSLAEVTENVKDALLAVHEIYEESGREFPANLLQDTDQAPVCFELLLPAA
ncbi:MAG: type II toxin-antitoxin system HicB family antitoxin [Candidatus Wallbacteria bacterium]|nr:type II toxin-antitoxin system HicB family antitoxin [Candidatus Wallbacteria bacterium]